MLLQHRNIEKQCQKRCINSKHLQATALVCYKVREIGQGKAVPEVKQRHGVWSQNSAPWRNKEEEEFTESRLSRSGVVTGFSTHKHIFFIFTKYWNVPNKSFQGIKCLLLTDYHPKPKYIYFNNILMYVLFNKTQGSS